MLFADENGRIPLNLADPTAAGKMAAIIADPDSPPDAVFETLDMAQTMIQVGVMTLALSANEEHIAEGECPFGDHSPQSHLRRFADVYDEGLEMLGISFEQIRAEWREWFADQLAMQAAESMPETLHVSDVIGEHVH